VSSLCVMCTEFDQQRLDIASRWMRCRDRPRACGYPCRDHVPIEIGEEGAIAPHHGIVIPRRPAHAGHARRRRLSWQQASGQVG